MNPFFRILAATFGLVGLALLGAWLGMSVPIHYGAVAPSVIEEAGRGSDTVVERAEWFLDAGKTGPARILLEMAPEEDPDAGRERRRLDRILEERPHFRASGGPAPFFEQFLEIIGWQPGSVPREQESVIEVAIPQAHREVLLGFLSQSANTVVHRLLETRSLSALTLFMPVDSAAGHPLDASILIAAMLVQGNHLPPELTRQLRLAADDALEGERPALDRIEHAYLALLTLSRRLDWTQLTELSARIPSLRTLQQTASFIRENPDGLAEFYAGTILGGDAEALLDYLREGGDEAWHDLRVSLGFGAGSVAELVRLQQPLYEPPPALGWVGGPLGIAREAWFPGLVYRYPVAAFLVKIGALFGSGLALACLIGVLTDLSPARGRRGRILRVGRQVFLGVFFALLIGLLLEPSLLRLSEPPPPSAPEFDFAISVSLDTLKTTIANPLMIDQATILILILFFVAQLIIYMFGLIKILEIKRRDAPAELKIKLLENEDNLFDLGLYVGLGGTAAALILLSLGIVQASLVAAYASTFFGIVFTAFLKVINLRPFRRSLILQNSFEEEEGSRTA